METVFSLKQQQKTHKKPKTNPNPKNPQQNKKKPTKNVQCLWPLDEHFEATAYFPTAQAEDQALLPEGDEQIDQRQWTQQHLEAADVCGSTSLALTPPQADQEVDVLDVNVRGPGQYSWVFMCSASQPPTSPVSNDGDN